MLNYEGMGKRDGKRKDKGLPGVVAHSIVGFVLGRVTGEQQDESKNKREQQT